MCFSPIASFAVAAATAAIGVAVVRHVARPRDVPLAIVPLLFAVHQVIEGLIWLELTGDGIGLDVSSLSLVYLIVAEVLWPVYTPIAILLIEPDRVRRRIIGAVAALAPILSIGLLLYLLEEPRSAVIQGHSIAYSSGADPLSWQQIPYLLCLFVPLFASSHRVIRAFGAVAMAGFVVSVYAYFAAFVSVWCFFGAAGSTLLYFYFRRAAQGVLQPNV